MTSAPCEESDKPWHPADNKHSGWTGPMPRLILVFAGRTYQFVRFRRFSVISDFLLHFRTMTSLKKEQHLKESKFSERQSKISADDILIFCFYVTEKIRLDFSCESYA